MDAPLKILLVDDDEVDRTMVRRALSAAGIAAEFAEADTGRAAIDRLKAGSFDCILLDHRLPDADGMNVLLEIRKAGILTPVLMLTGQGDERLAVEMMKAGASDYLSKTRLSRDLLSHAVRHAVGLHRARSDAELARALTLESEERFRRMADSAPVLLWVTDEQGNCTYLNHAWLTFTGRTAADSLGRGWLGDVHPDDAARVMDVCADAYARQSGFDVDYRLRRSDGEYRWISSSAAPRRLADGTFAGFVGSCVDVTDRRRADADRAELLAREQAARAEAEASERHYRFLAECMPQMIFTARADGRVDYFNGRWRDYVGHLPHGDPHLPWAPTVHPQDAPTAERRWTDCMRTGKPYEIEYRLRRHDGVYRWHLTRAEALRDVDGAILKWFGTCTDIEEQRRNADALHFLAEASEVLASSLDYQTTLASVAKLAVPRIADWCAIDILDDDGSPRRLTLVHSDPAKVRAAEEFHRLYPPDENDPVNRVIGSGNAELFAEITDAMIEQGTPDRRKAKLLRAMGIRSALVVPLPGRDGPIGALTLVSSESGHRFGSPELALAEDLTRRAGAAVENALLYRELSAAKDAAEGANAAKDRFLAVLSHELRTPLTPVLATVQAMESDPALPAEFQPGLEMIRRNVELEARLIDDLLDLTRVAKGKLELNPQAIDAHASLRNALEICYDELHGKGLQLSVDLTACEHHVRADSARLQQVFWNLIKNAIKFTPEGGRIAIRTFDEPDGRGLHVEFRDSGIGIDPRVLPEIFNAFEQGERSITRRFGGLGLGLAITKALVDMQGGTITADSGGPNKGAVFVVRMPTVEPPAAPLHAPAPRDDAGIGQGLRILLVDDHEDTAKAMRRLLERSGHDITLAFNVHDALGEFGRADFDLLISDIGLPDGSGLELMRQIRAQKTIRGIALSGFGMEEDIRKSKEAGFNEHLIKPINFQRLQDVIREVSAKSVS